MLGPAGVPLYRVTWHGLAEGAREADPGTGGAALPGLVGFRLMRPEHYLTAADVADDALVHGMVAFHFACYSAGTPSFDPFLIDEQTRPPDRSQGPRPIAERPFVAALHQRMLAHPNGGALAVLGHIERAWGYSICPPGVGSQPGLSQPPRPHPGRRAGGSLDQGLQREVHRVSADLLDQIDEARPGPRPKDQVLAWTWVERNDAQSYVVLGDPAVRLRVGLLTGGGKPDIARIPMNTPTPALATPQVSPPVAGGDRGPAASSSRHTRRSSRAAGSTTCWWWAN